MVVGTNANASCGATITTNNAALKKCINFSKFDIAQCSPFVSVFLFMFHHSLLECFLKGKCCCCCQNGMMKVMTDDANRESFFESDTVPIYRYHIFRLSVYRYRWTARKPVPRTSLETVIAGTTTIRSANSNTQPQPTRLR